MPRRLRVGVSPGNWAARSTAPGVVRAFGFDSDADRGNTPGPGDGYVEYRPYGSRTGAQYISEIDTAVHTPSGAGALRFKIDPGVNSESGGGEWWANFSDNGSVRFGANSEVYVQWRQRWNQAFIDTYILDATGSNQAGIKQMDIVPGDTMGQYPGGEYTSNPNYGGKLVVTDEDSKVVVQSRFHARFTHIYAHNWSMQDEALVSTTSGENEYQNQLSPMCVASSIPAPPSTSAGPYCFPWLANQWMTFQFMLKIGTRGTFGGAPAWIGNEVKLWCAHEGDPQQLVHWYKPGVAGYRELRRSSDLQDEYGKVTFFPYMTGKNATQQHDQFVTWIDELIISSSFIPDPVD